VKYNMMLADSPTQVIGQNLDPVSNAGFGGNYIMLPDRRRPIRGDNGPGGFGTF
jgi:hypothetical protein